REPVPGHREPGEDEDGRGRVPPELRRGLRKGRRRRRARHRQGGVLHRAREGPALTGRFLQYYRENANWLERTYDFVPRVGLEKIQQVLLEDSEGIVADLDSALQRSIDAYTEPWGQDANQ